MASNMHNSQQVMRQPFDIETHKNTFINYLEVIIESDGTVVYAVPSHQEKLIALACRKLGMTRDELNDFCPPEYYFDFMNWLCQITNCIALWNDHSLGTANELQKETIHTLASVGLYRGPLQ